ncbi:ParB/RepB/Spo0J family partition protein [Fimbriiglobus ruber]|uniref:Chromosome (Plasmid) partitioning protein ParB / Stage 0 sporulation protein J n=1 Tax=Fimbriiglobus ruber TaxID=1908690 RepID=A0A225DDB5_9BACT|nr:ParB/RepB/Spo0J family partition protein [Fimbriiglobus ruber]OWK38939.1 hypothetical protein FRUB_06315 [Fimbriiglobus ruber]OWK38973.1 Chromosome (plasmid) partitioning protein ParB / Stage 0 sporulation protein J [Fimbriiglobus ruber]
MDKLTTPTRQQREIRAELGQTLGNFHPGQLPYPDARAAEPPARRRNPRALIVAASRIKTDPGQVRQKERDPSSERIQDLAKSITAVGLQQPPGVRETADGMYEIVYGEGRFVAMTEVLGWTEIEVMRVDVEAENLIWHQLHENIHRTNLDPLDLAAAVRQAQAQGHSLSQIAERMSKSETWVQKALTVSERLSEPAWQTLAASGERQAMDTVYAIAQVPPEAQEEIAREVVEKKLTRRETEALVETAKKKRTVAETPKRSGRKKKGKPYETTLRTAAGASVTVKFRKVEVEPSDVITALEEALQSLRQGIRSAA